MAEILEGNSIQWVEVPRIEAGGLPISATRVRAAFARNDVEVLRSLVPGTTLEFLQSHAARAIADRLRIQMEGA
jgi:[citrate (pro-3S)-lyase] ligase